MTTIPYPSWINRDCRQAGTESEPDTEAKLELKEQTLDRDTAPYIGRVVAYTTQIETFKTLAIIKEIAELKLPQLEKHYQKLLKTLSDDTQHIAMLSTIGVAVKGFTCIDEDLNYSLEQLLSMRETGYALAIASMIVIPSYTAIVDYISSRTKIPIVRNLYREIAEAEKSNQEHLIAYIKDLELDEDSLANMLEEKALLMFASAAASDEIKKGIATIVEGAPVGSVEEASKSLGGLYSEIDRSRSEAITKIYGEDSRILDIARKYGLSGLALC